MKILEAKTLLIDNLKHHGVEDVWEPIMAEHLDTNGECNQMYFTISLKRSWIEKHSIKEVLDIIHHEIAHTDMPIGYGHGDLWEENYNKIKRSWQNKIYNQSRKVALAITL